MIISKIYAVSDIHIRLYKRHKEYEQVFKRLFQYIEETKDENSVIFLGGDLVHNKTDMTPELIQVTSNFLKRCADLLPTILILGNHDTNLNNSVRLDALSPIVSTLNHPNLHYWKESGVYKLNGVSFSVFGILESSDKWILANSVKGKYKIALHHGPIYGCQTDLTVLETGTKLDLFDGFDLGLLGDIHTRQYLNEERTIAYAGSLIQQNFGESIEDHGILVWDIKKKKAEFVPIKNDFGYYTFNVINGKCDIPDNLPKNLRVRIKYENTASSELQSIIQRISKKYKILEIIKQKSILSDASSLSKNDILGNSRDVEYQNKIIGEYLTALGEFTTDEISSVLQLNSETNKLLPIQKITRDVTWKPIKLEFSNMFCYGEDNCISFENFSGIYGIFSANASGKSSILDILSFAIYDKSTRASKASHILNNNKDRFHCKFQFDLNGIEYFIERIGTKYNTNSVRVDVDFWYYNESGEKISLNGEDRDKTNYAIRDMLGTYDDFVMTALSTQYDNQNFVEKSQRDRKELLYKFLDIFIYDELYKAAKESSREYAVLIREMERENFHEKSSQLYQVIVKIESSLEEIDFQLDTIRSQIKDNTNDLFELNKQYLPSKEDLNIREIELETSECINELTKIVDRTKEIQSSILQYTELTKQLDSERNSLIDFNDVQFFLNELNKVTIDLGVIEKEIHDLENKIKYCEDRKNQLENHEYDPNCKFCINNEFVLDAKESIRLLPQLQELVSFKRGILSELEFARKERNANLEKSKRFELLTNEIDRNIRELTFLRETEESLKFKGNSLRSRLNDSRNRKEEYFKNSAIIEKNAEILENISNVKREISQLELQEKKLQTNHRDKFSELERKKKEYEQCIQSIDKYTEHIKKYRIYDIYLQALSRDGVPYKIVEAILPIIENEVNLILNSVVNFTIRLEATDEKYIHAFIVYENSNSWPIELTSGMERFILSLAFRTALSDITSLPKANFIAIDEGFGVLDSDNIMQMGKLFQYLKSQYEYLVCISHIESMKDLVDNQIMIDKVNGYSRLKYD